MYVILLAAMIFISATLAGMFAPPFKEGKDVANDPKTYQCCNTGDGSDCKPDPSVPTQTYKGQKYGLLKSNVYLKNINPDEHFDPSKTGNGNGINQVDGQNVFLNVVPEGRSRDQLGDHEPQCHLPNDEGEFNAYKSTVDWLYGRKEAGDTSNKDYGCYEVPNDMLIYVCRSDNDPSNCNEPPSAKNARFDVWIRMKEAGQDGDIQKNYSFISTCFKPDESEEAYGEKKIVFRPSPGGGQDNLQLRTFSFIEPMKPAVWLSPYCKPAIYLYPEQKTEINVSVFPQGKMLLTIPPYPKDGWDVIADPTGAISYQNKQFDYLYYEASIPDQLITKPKEGFVVAYDKREAFMRDLVTKLGLNEKETAQFVEYWTPILPKSPYYFIGVVPVTNLHEISPLLITPKPDNLIRVTLYFQALNTPITVTPPRILPVSRTGFTAVEWGGIFKRDKDHPFSCFM